MTIHNNALYAEVGNRVRHQVQVGLERAERFYPRLCTVIDSTQDSENYDWLGAFPEVYEWLGDMVFDQLASAEFQIRNKDWANGIRLPKKKIDDGNSGYFTRMGEGLVEMFARHPDKVLFQLMAAAETIECFDGQFFFDTDHVWGDSGVQSNLLTIDVSDPTKPTTEELLDAVTQVLLNMLTYKNDRGEPFVFPTAHDFSDLVITCSPNLWPIFDKAFQAKLVLETNAAGTAGAAVDKFTLTRPEIIPLVQYTGNQFDVYRTGQSIKPFVFQDRQAITMFTKNYDDPEEKDVKVGGNGRYNLGVLAWWLANRVKLV
ncbi:Mu-like prophage major head subunit gpT family protein [Planctomycetes bacterium TBK1r]|uniref:Mu-like prophage major head subunit gpT n=1 Tax=Stieleria magnilauensis TaxID=2527963 RepID=A0ABX5XSJ9_9BACT|nr:Mu-like prophage major head subunit gpT [Planctomycetes bacterium TBK1r]